MLLSLSLSLLWLLLLLLLLLLMVVVVVAVNICIARLHFIRLLVFVFFLIFTQEWCRLWHVGLARVSTSLVEKKKTEWGSQEQKTIDPQRMSASSQLLFLLLPMQLHKLHAKPRG